MLLTDRQGKDTSFCRTLSASQNQALTAEFEIDWTSCKPREVEIGLSPLRPRMRSGCLAVLDGLPAGRAGAVRGAAGQHGPTSARERGGRAQKRAGSRPRSQPGWLPLPDPHLSG